MNTDKNSQSTPSGTPAQPEQTVSDSHQHRPTPGQLAYDEWRAKYRPIKNSMDDGADYDGCLFRPHGPEYSYVRTCPLCYIWTLSDMCGCHSTIVSGAFEFDVTGYFITEVPSPDGRLTRIHLENEEEE